MQRLAIDIGGTFTDAVTIDEGSGNIFLSKVPSTPKDYSVGLMESIEKAQVNFKDLQFFAHGTTVCLNALIQGLLASTALITTQGFRDIIEIGRGNRVEIYDPFYTSPRPLVPRRLRFEVSERLRYDGTEMKPLNETEAQLVASQVSGKVKSVAISFFHSYRNDSHEAIMKRILEQTNPQLFITASSDISKEYYDYERTYTAILNAGLMPIMKTYISRIEGQLRTQNYERDLFIMQSNGGMMSSSLAKERPVFTINSGLVGGIIAVRALSKLLGIPNVIGADMGGTSFDVELVIDGEYQMRQVMKIKTPTSGSDGYPVLFPTVDIHAIGAGGGSVAWVDEGGALHVGPKSAAAEPGPACYGRGGTEPTVTDANLVLGRLSERNFLGGEMKVYPDLSKKAIRKIADLFHMSVEEAAAGILKIVINNMAGAIETMTVKKGIDPRGCVMISFGGAGPLHGAAIARELRIPEVIVATMPGNFSAWGMLMADLKHDYVQTVIKLVDDVKNDELRDIFFSMENRARKDLSDEGINTREMQFIYGLDMRYLGQGHALTVTVGSKDFTDKEIELAKKSFDDMYLKTYLHNAPSEPKELVSLRLTAFGLVTKAKLPEISEGGTQPSADSHKETRSVYFDEGSVSCPVYDRTRLKAKNRIRGPAVVEEPTSTTLVWPNNEAVVDNYGLLHIRFD